MPRFATVSALMIAVGMPFVAVFQAQAQITNVTNDQSTPIPGAGHDYIDMLNETVNLSNGSLSLRIRVPTPPGRGFSLPFAFDYDSNGIHHFVSSTGGRVIWTNDSTLLEVGGWSYALPVLSDSSATLFSLSHPGNSCSVHINYVFRGPDGSRHSFATLSIGNKTLCTQRFVNFSYSANGSDVQYAAFTDSSATSDLSPFTVRDGHGTIYHFASLVSSACTNSCSLPDYVEDRNGNRATIDHPTSTTFTIQDSLARNLVAVSGFGADGNTVSVSGHSTPYTLHWASKSFNYSVQPNITFNGDGSCAITAVQGSAPSVTSIVLPNGKSYQFFYDSMFGLVNKVVYPEGGYVRYVWGINLNSDFAVWLDNAGGSNSCVASYGSPVITHRYVSFDGVTEVLQQDFSYSTTPSGSPWTGKTTTVTTTDLRRGQPGFQTVYSYIPASIPRNPNSGSAKLVDVAHAVPVENTITYKNTSGTTLKTVTKTWQNPYLMTSETVALENGQTSEIAFSYGPFGVITEKDEYDYGSGAVGPLLRRTVTNYASFPLTALGADIADAPCQTIAYDGLGNRAAETDTFYDNGSTGTPCSAPGIPSVAASSALTGHDETNYSASSTVSRGNATTKKSLCLQGAPVCTSDPITTYAYDETGQLVSVTDPKGNTTQYSFVDNYLSGTGTPPGNTNAYVTTITYPTVSGIAQHKYFQYGYSDGQLTQSQDDNQKTSGLAAHYVYNDSLRRLTETDYPDGGKSTFSYNDTAPNPSITTSKLIQAPTTNLTTVEVVDGIGHPVQSQLTSDPEGTDFTDTTYDGPGRVWKQSNPHRSVGSSTDGTTTYIYDSIGRVCLVVPPDGIQPSGSTCPTTRPAGDSFTTYSGNCTTVTDEAGISRKSCSDGLGRLTQVFEDPSGLNYETDYTYNTLDNLLTVNQKGGDPNSANWRSRTFTYDSLSRLISATNPESGTVSYTYDANGNVSSKTAPTANQTGSATVTTTYTYDALNRLIQKIYSDGTTPTNKFGYDGVALMSCTTAPPALTDSNPNGQRTSMCDGSGATSWAHDSMGRVLTEKRSIVGTSVSTKSAGYTYNLDGSVATISNPGVGRVMTYTTTGAGRQASVVNTGGSINFLTSATYAPPGELATYTNGGTINISNTYNSRLQPATLSAATTGGTSILNLTYDFHSSTHANNGNVFQIVNGRDTNRTQNFIYDSLNRIQQAYTTGNSPLPTSWGETFSPTATSPGVPPSSPGIDAWGNFTNRSGVTGKTNYEGLSAAPASVKNQLNGYCYDSAGNLVLNSPCPQPPGTSFTPVYSYDAENRLSTTAGWTYVYDGDGHRVKKFSGSTGTLYWPDLSGNTLNESSLGATNLHEYVYFSGKRVARIDVPTPLTVKYYFSDHLGSASVITDASGSILEESDFYPYGGEIAITNNDSNIYKFTGKERDSESGLDMFGARYYGSSLGRFMTPDWAARPTAVPYSQFEDPQTLNLYAYVRNNPLWKADLDGHGWWDKLKNYLGDAGCWCEGPQAAAAAAQTRIKREQARREFARAANSPEGRRYMAFFAIYGGTMGAVAMFTAQEEAIAGTLETEGYEVEPIEPVQGQKNPDANVTAPGATEAVKTEFKTVTVAGQNTLKNQIQDGLRQAPNVVVDVRGTSITKAEALQQIQRVEGNVGSVQGRVMVITNEGIIKH